MSDLHDLNEMGEIVNAVGNAIITLTNAMTFGFA
jgi:hypothetical protein